MKYDVTIGIPMYNVEDYIKRTMESALSQTYHSVEYLVVDDGSNDNSLCVISELQAKHPRGKDIRIVIHKENLGPSTARNCIIEEARGDFLFFLDSDDIIREDTISLMMAQVRKYNTDIVFGSMEKILLSGERLLYQYPPLRFSDKDEFAFFSYRRYAGIQASACNCLVRLSVVRDNGLKFYLSNFWEDFVFVLDLVTYIDKAVLLPDITYTYLCRRNSLSNYQQRELVDKDEVLRNIAVAEYMKSGCARLKEKPYYPQRCYIAMMTDFYISCTILRRRKNIVPPISNQELKMLFSHPASLSQICAFRQLRLENFVLYFIGKLPSLLCVSIIGMLGKKKKLI